MSVKRVNMSFDNILLFTDLDGTLLNKKTFEFKAALDLIKNCISKGINIIPNSSKTDLELDEICEKLEIPKVYISENGSCIYGLNFLSDKLNEKICLSRNKEIIFKNFSYKPAVAEFPVSAGKKIAVFLLPSTMLLYFLK